MAWSDPTANLTFSTAEVVTAAKMNLIRDDLIDLDRRTSPVAATVATSETTTSATYTDLATTGPAATFTVGSTGKLEVVLYSALSNNTTGDAADISFALSGANTQAAAAAFSLTYGAFTGGASQRQGATWLLTGLTGGSTTATCKYERITGGTATFSDRKIVCTPFGS